MPDGYKTGLNNTTSGVLVSNICARKRLREEANLHFAPFFLSNIQADTSYSACNTKNCSILVVLLLNHPRDSNARGRKKLEPCHLKPDERSQKTHRIRCWSTAGQHPCRLHQRRSEICDFVCKSCFIHWDLAKRVYHRKPPPHLRVPSHCREPYYRPSQWSQLTILKTTPSSSPWTIYTILILKHGGLGSSRPDYLVQSLVWLMTLYTTPNCQRHGYA